MLVPVRRLALAVALLSTLTAAAQDVPRVPTLGESIEVSLVNLDVIVTDRDGKRVRGLTKDDFVVLENGKRREITNFAEYASGGGETSVETGASAPQPPAQKRTVAIFMERTNLLPHKAQELIASLRGAVRGIVRNGDEVSLVFWTKHGQTRFDFRKNPDQVDAVLAELEKDIAGSPRDLTEQFRREAADLQQFEMEVLAITGGEAPRGNDLLSAVDNDAMFRALMQLSEMQRKAHAINALINSMASLEGKKILLLVTHRFGEIAGREFFVAAGQAMPDTRLLKKTRELIDSIALNANAAEVTVYPVYPTGLPNRVDAGGGDYLVQMNEMLSLQRIAADTGGLEAAGTAEFAGVVRQLQDDVTDYYSLAYRVDAPSGDRKRDLEVKMKDPHLTVRARRNFVEKSDATRMKDRVLMALFRTSTESMFPIAAQLGATRKGRVAKTPLRVRIPIKALTFVAEKGAHVGAFSVYVVAGDTSSKLSDVQQQTQRFEIPAKDLERAMSGYFTYDLDVVLARKTDRVIVGVLDEVSKSFSVKRVPVVSQ